MTTATATAARTSVPVSTIAEELMAGRPEPVRDFRTPLNHRTVSALMESRRVWWLDVAIGYANLASKALAHGDVEGAREALGDHDEAMRGAAYFGCKTIGR